MSDPHDFQWVCDRGFRDAGYAPGDHYTVDDDFLTICYGEEAIEDFDPDKHAWIEVHGPYQSDQEILADLVMAHARAFHGYKGDLSNVREGDFVRLARTLRVLCLSKTQTEINAALDEGRALLSRLTEGGGDG